jgi:hypothetical protein
MSLLLKILQILIIKEIIKMNTLFLVLKQLNLMVVINLIIRPIRNKLLHKQTILIYNTIEVLILFKTHSKVKDKKCHLERFNINLNRIKKILV